MIRSFFTAACFFVFNTMDSSAQQQTDSLFNSLTPLDIGITISIKEIQKSKNDTTWYSNKLYYRSPTQEYDSIKVELKGRGNFRLNNCYFPPLGIKIEKKHAKATVFEGNKKLKFVLPCNHQQGSNDLVLLEWLCYKLYEEISPYAFKTRLVNVNVMELNGKKVKNFQLKGILIEDLEKTAKRLNGQSQEKAKVSPNILQDTNALRFYLFQLLISNTDWSELTQHNTRLLSLSPRKYIMMPYDFDMSGLVDAPYAMVSAIDNENLPVNSVRQRYYRGFCRSPEITEFVRREFIAKKEKLLSIPDLLKGELSDKGIKEVKAYLGSFFEILEKDNLFTYHVLDKCRAFY